MTEGPLYFLDALVQPGNCGVSYAGRGRCAPSPFPGHGDSVRDLHSRRYEFSCFRHLTGPGQRYADEHIAAEYAAALFTSFGLEPGGEGGSFLQKAPLPSPLPPRVEKHWQGSPRFARTDTWNVVGILRGADPAARTDAILLTAHLDHLGVGPAKNGDTIYNGADDDASGATAVLELARVFAKSARPARTVIFALFGSEELGGYGNQYFLDHPPVPLDKILANLELK